jgi:cleavage and polyadenylation specificity factor subunit 2
MHEEALRLNMRLLFHSYRHLELFPSPAALLHTYPSSKPKLILAVPTSLSHSSSRSLFADFASVPGNVVVLTTRPEPGTLGGILFDTWNEAQPADSEYGKGKMGRVIEGKDEMISVKVGLFNLERYSHSSFDGLKIKSKVPLAGAELEAHLAQERATKERETAHKAALARSQRMLEADEEESDSEASDSEDDEANIDKALAVKDSAGLGEGGMDWSLLDSDDIQPRTQQLSFDIFLKGNVSKATSFFKPVAGSAGNQGGLVR